MSKEIEISILDGGEIQVSRQDKEGNVSILDILDIMCGEKDKDLHEFFDERDKIKVSKDTGLGNLGEFSGMSWCG
jgi:hypothetical protein